MVFINILPTTYWFCLCLTNLKISGIVGSALTAVTCIAGLVSCISPACGIIYDSDQRSFYSFLHYTRILFIFVQAVLLISSIALIVIFILDLRRFLFVGEVVVFCGFLAYPITSIFFMMFYCLQLILSMVDCGDALDVILFFVYNSMVVQFSLPVNSYCYLIWLEKQLNIHDS